MIMIFLGELIWCEILSICVFWMGSGHVVKSVVDSLSLLYLPTE
jgi:hypothetical protein